MADPLSEAEVGYVLEHGDLHLYEPFTWTGRSGRSKFSVGIGNNQNLDLRLDGNWNPRTGNFSFALLYPAGQQALRRYCARGTHTNYGHLGERLTLRGAHKHTWLDAYEDRHAYVPADITATDIMDALAQFLTECHVAITAELPDPPSVPPRQQAL